MQALDDYISARHAEGVDDGVAGAIGGIRLYKIVHKFPDVGEPVERYHFDPFSPVPRTSGATCITRPAPSESGDARTCDALAVRAAADRAPRDDPDRRAARDPRLHVVARDPRR